MFKELFRGLDAIGSRLDLSAAVSMAHPLLPSVLGEYPHVDVESLVFPEGSDSWDLESLKLFVGSGGFIVPKRKKAPEVAAYPTHSPPSTVDLKPPAVKAVAPATSQSGKRAQSPNVGTTQDQKDAPAEAKPATASRSAPDPSKKEVSYTDVDGKPWAEMIVRVNMEDTAPTGCI